MSNKSDQDIVILGAARTPTGKMSGSLTRQQRIWVADWQGAGNLVVVELEKGGKGTAVH
jgi:hypothetical protein